MEYASEIHKLLKIGQPSEHDEAHATPADTHLPVALPVAAGHAEAAILPHHVPAPDVQAEAAEITRGSGWKALIIYPLVFAAAFGFFYVVLNFSSLLAQVQGFFTKPQQQVQLGTATAEYENWIKSYYFGVSDAALLDP